MYLLLKENGKFVFSKAAIVVITIYLFVSIGTILFSSSISLKHHPIAINNRFDYIQAYEIKSDTIKIDYYNYYGHQNHTSKFVIKTSCTLKNLDTTKTYFFKDGSMIKNITCYNDTVLFLSDYGKGPGLFNLFYIPKKEFSFSKWKINE